MKRTLALFTLLLLLILTVGAVSAHSLNFSAALSGANEVPPVVTDTTGWADFKLNGSANKLKYELHVENGVDLLAVAGAHIHCAPAGVNGPVVAFLARPVAGGIDGTIHVKGNLRDEDIVNTGTACGATIAELGQAMINGMTYVNVHSAANPGGVVRGQIVLGD